jgi:hypothetical protein
MNSKESAERHARAAEEFNRHEHRSDGAVVAGSLAAGLDLLRDSLYFRLHQDVEKMFGVDSMWLPASAVKTEIHTKTEIELYQIAESTAVVQECGYVQAARDWYLPWLTGLRLRDALAGDPHGKRLEDYLDKSPDDRRLAFTDVLDEVLPESQRAPLVLFRLVPWSIRIATSLAFGDHERAREARTTQVGLLPAIGYCHACRGEVLENGEQCRGCGNPMWKSDWLTATD